MLLVSKWPVFAKATPGKAQSGHAEFISASPRSGLNVDVQRSDREILKQVQDDIVRDDAFEIVKEIITQIRAARAENKIEPVKKIKAVISAGDKKKIISKNSAVIKGLGRLEDLIVKTKVKKPKNYLGFVAVGVEVYLDLLGDIDVEKEKARIGKELEETEKYFTSLQSKLNNQDFVAHAPAVVVEKERTKLKEAEEKLGKLKEQLERL
jgi:valyl-tRNA synthetase